MEPKQALVQVLRPQSLLVRFTAILLSAAMVTNAFAGAFADFGYESRHRTTAVTHKKSDNSTISSESYSWNSGSNLTSKTVDSLTTSFTYDDADQLLTEARTGYSSSYTHDANGNRSTKTLGGSPTLARTTMRTS